MKAYKKEILKSWWNENLDYLPLGAKWRGKWQKRVVKRIIREIDERKLDILIAEKVFRRKVEILEFSDYDSDYETYYPELAFKVHHSEDNVGWVENTILPDYSTDLKDSFEIVKKISFPITMTQNLSSYEEMEKGNEWEVDFYAGEYKAFAKTLPEAICLAALKTIGINYE